jgi:hypothetical protein
VADRLRQVRRGRTDYLSRIARADPDAVVESRWLGGGGWPVRQFLLGRVDAPDPAAVMSRAGRLREAMLGLPTYLSAEPLDRATEILGVLRPFVPNHRVELRKRRVRVQPADTRRRDLPPDGIQVVVPFPAGLAPGPSLEALLATARHPTMVGVALRSRRLGRDHLAAVEDRHRWYRALSEATTMTTLGLYGQREVPLAPVPLAAEAADLVADAARRYCGDTFRIRIGLASAGPLPAQFSVALADLLVPPPDPGGPGAALLSGLADGRACRIQQPANPEQVSVFDDNLTTVDLDRWAPIPQAWLEALAGVVDGREAATVFRLPGDVATEPTPGGGPVGDVPGTGQPACPVPIGWGVRDGVRTERIFVEATGPLAVLGAPGSGSSRTIRTLLRQLWVRRRVPFLVIESGAGTYRQLLTEPGFADLVVLTAGVEHVAPLRLSPGDLPVDWLDAALTAAFRDPPDAGALLASLGRDRTLADAAWQSDDPALRRWCRQRCEGPAGTVFDTRAGLPAARFANRPLIVELAGLPQRDDRVFAAALLLSQVATASQHLGPRVTVVHDAHELLDGTAQPLLARVGHGTTLVADPAELAPALLPADGMVLLHRGSYHRLGLPDPGARGTGRVRVGNPDQGWHDVMPDAVPATPDPTDAGAVVPDAMVRARFTRDIESWRDSLAPYRDCEGCRFPCELRAASLRAVDRNRAETFLAMLHGFPASDPLDAGAWWRHLDEHLTGYGPPHRDPLRRADQRACLLLHLHRAATGMPAGFWVRRYRQVFCR